MTDSPWAPAPVSEPAPAPVPEPAPVVPPVVIPTPPAGPAADAWTPEPVKPAAPAPAEDEPEGGWIAYQDEQGWHRIPRKDYKG